MASSKIFAVLFIKIKIIILFYFLVFSLYCIEQIVNIEMVAVRMLSMVLEAASLSCFFRQ